MAAEKKLPILLNFSGSDWCGWCKLMEKNVFSEPKWKDYAKDNLMMVVLDFPKNTKLVPEKFVKRNDELKAKYEVEGFPTFIVLDDDASTVLGQLGAGQDTTPESFAAEVRRFSGTAPPKSPSTPKLSAPPTRPRTSRSSTR